MWGGMPRVGVYIEVALKGHLRGDDRLKSGASRAFQCGFREIIGVESGCKNDGRARGAAGPAFFQNYCAIANNGEWGIGFTIGKYPKKEFER
jgi:hypothetical protein